MVMFSKRNNSKVSNNNSSMATISARTRLSFLILTAVLSNSVIADTGVPVNSKNSIKVSQQQSNKAHVIVIHKEIAHTNNSLQKNNNPTSDDSAIGAYSLSDGAMRGEYGDGVYYSAE